MQSFITLRHETDDVLPEGTDDVRTPRAYVEHFLRAFTDPGDTVFDPFAGFGTTLSVAQALVREASDIEYEQERVAVARERLSDPAEIEQGGARDLDPHDVSSHDCCLTSPPLQGRPGRPEPAGELRRRE